jgi:hypothetical protein
MSAGVAPANPPALADKAGETLLAHLAQSLGRLPLRQGGVHKAGAATQVAGEPAIRPHLHVQIAQAAQVVIVAAAGAAEFIGPGQPVEGDVCPEQLKERPHLLPAALASTEGLGQDETVEIGAVVGGAAVLVGAELPGVEADSVQAGVALVRHLGLL